MIKLNEKEVRFLDDVFMPIIQKLEKKHKKQLKLTNSDNFVDTLTDFMTKKIVNKNVLNKMVDILYDHKFEDFNDIILYINNKMDINNKKYNQEHSWMIMVNCGKDKSYRYFHNGDKQINLKKCQKIVDEIEKLNHIKVDEIEIIMDTYDYDIDIDTFLSVSYGDTMLTKILDKQVTYVVNQNCMRIYKNHECIYENNNGNICNDYYTLADCN